MQKGSSWAKSFSPPGEGANSLHLSLDLSSLATGIRIYIVSKYIHASIAPSFFSLNLWFRHWCWLIYGLWRLIIIIFILFYINYLLLFWRVKPWWNFLNRGPAVCLNIGLDLAESGLELGNEWTAPIWICKLALWVRSLSIKSKGTTTFTVSLVLKIWYPWWLCCLSLVLEETYVNIYNIIFWHTDILWHKILHFTYITYKYVLSMYT